ncbi:MAG: hypothetical protein WBE68_05530 [Candidatus Nitrosopolaris sp.]
MRNAKDITDIYLTGKTPSEVQISQLIDLQYPKEKTLDPCIAMHAQLLAVIDATLSKQFRLTQSLSGTNSNTHPVDQKSTS